MITLFRRVKAASALSSVLLCTLITTPGFVIANATGFIDYNPFKNIIVMLSGSVSAGVVGHFLARVKMKEKVS